ncbi:unnamed protein product [Lactuca virosa]|uniref:Uncharacterized protein n=1 Tax=Lactuca virosa TaxID=75947 RepID=A0AAU9PU34_9ASTR|nr:unnamed protein product [Lactuca virosa]
MTNSMRPPFPFVLPIKFVISPLYATSTRKKIVALMTVGAHLRLSCGIEESRRADLHAEESSDTTRPRGTSSSKGKEPAV